METLFLNLLFPLAPHISSYFWNQTEPISSAPWPKVDQEALKSLQQAVIVQVNGKRRGEIPLPEDADESTVLTLIQERPSIQKHLDGHTIKRVVIIKGRLVNIVV